MNREKLLAAVERVMPAVTESNLTEQNNLIIFNKKEVVSYDNEILIISPIKVGIEGAVPANELLKLLTKIKDKKIEVNQKDKILEIKGGLTIAEFKITDIKIPPIERPTKWKTLPKDFIKGITYCKSSVASGTGNILNNILLNKDKILSCDNYRVTEYTMEREIFKKHYFIPSSVINTLLLFAPTYFSSNKQWLFFKNKDEEILCIKTPNIEFPDISSILDSKIKGVKIKLPSQLKESLERTKILSEEDIMTGNHILNITIKDNKLICSGECAAGKIEETIKIKYKGEKIMFTIVPDFLFEVLDKTENILIGESALKFKTKKLQHRIQLIK